MAYVTSFPPSGSPVSNAPVGSFGSNAMQTGLAIQGSNAKVYNYVQNLAASVPLYISFGAPASTGQCHVIIFASGAPFIDPGMVKVPIYVSGGSYLAWSM